MHAVVGVQEDRDTTEHAHRKARGLNAFCEASRLGLDLLLDSSVHGERGQ
jgi:hypothetical protein